jgi:hypothetical protein
MLVNPTVVPGCTTPVGTEEAVPAPPLFEAVTATTIAELTSLEATV